ncbi:MAG: GNAT family N-acetyltransferase [Nannocystaceae bacterium]|nr:GNAT family N-acetyltransferase [Nannocystaceae bacterium]
MTIEFQPLPSLEPVASLRRQYVQQAVAPLDGMWLCGLTPAAAHVGFVHDGQVAGYYSLNDDGFLMQFHVDEPLRPRAMELLDTVVTQREVAGAFASTAEPEYLSLCLDHFPRAEVNALMYQQHTSLGPDASMGLKVLSHSQHAEAVAFAHDAIGAPEAWLNDYYGGLIEREELFGLWEGETLIGAGESRGFGGLQPGYADLGVIVATAHRGHGVATRILRDLVRTNEARELRSICSTEAGNTAAQAAIARAGFVPRHRILQLRPS